MELQSLSSIFELFATFALAYIVIDELTGNPFIATITDKILRKYKKVDDIFSNIAKDINGVENSLNEIIQANTDPELLPEINSHFAKLKSTKARCENSKNEIRKEIMGSYSTKVFSYLNCYLFFYCLTMLSYGGVYSSNSWYQTNWSTGSIFRAKVDSSLFLFTISSVLFIGLGWWFDKNKKETDKMNFIESVYQARLINGYVFSFFACMIACGLGVTGFFLRWSFFPPENMRVHNFLIIGCVIMPILNFIIYVVKASWRANKFLPRVVELAKTFENDYQKELEIVRSFIGWWGHEQLKKLKISETVSLES